MNAVGGFSEKDIKAFESAMLLKDLKAGETLTQRQVEAIERLLGGILQPLRELVPVSTTVKFRDGKPYVEGPNPLGITISETEGDE